ncbi:hypothetical protein ACFS27_00600 [Promicromonospora vindobonensis]|uniref:MmpS family membrane protein n=1 Tax=Promicromonospora vindobonensis TaxID=195748 RepID=A0ABW5VLZ1_9MICO
MTTPPVGPGHDYASGPALPPPPTGAQYGYPAQYAPAPRPRKTGPKVLTFTGVAVLVAGVIAGIVGVVGAAGGIADLLPTDLVTTEGTAGSDAIALETSTEPLTFDASDEGAYLVFEVSQDQSARLPASAVTAEGPNGPVGIEPPDQTGALPTNGWSVFPVGVVVPQETGPHTLVVDGAVASPDVGLAVSGPLNVDSVAGIGSSGLVVLVGFLVGGLGFLLLIAGIIWWAVAKK